MGRLLHIIASPRQEESNTLQVSKAFLEAFKAKHPDFAIDELNLSTEDLPDLNMKRVDGKYVLLDGKDLFGELKEAWEGILFHINRFLSADIYLICSPMWNFHVPYRLKQYIDVIVQPRYLFRYKESGEVEGLVKGKKMVVVSTRGGNYDSKEMVAFDLQEPYFRAIFGYVGITDISFIKAEPMGRGKELKVQKIAEAKEAAKRLVGEI